MTDIQQWRRMIQPARTRTPAVEQEEAEAFLSPTTPRKGLKPKFSSYFNQHANNTGPGKKESSPPRNVEDLEWPSWPAEDPYPSPDADVLIDSVMCRILGSTYDGLHPRFNNILLQIFEGFRTMADEKQRLLVKSEQDSDRISALEKIMQKSAQQWNSEREDYKAEIKRLELLLAKGKRGLAEVTLARQDSLLRQRQAERSTKARKHDSLETIFKFMEKNKRVEEKVWSFQRGGSPQPAQRGAGRCSMDSHTETDLGTATMRTNSPSSDMRRLSKTLMSQAGSYPELPPGTLTEGRSTLAEASYLEERSSMDRKRAISDPKTSFSEEDTISTFSCAGDLLPDENTKANPVEVPGLDSDLAAIRRIAQVLATRRNMNIDTIMPKLLEMFGAQSLDAQTSKTASPPTHPAIGQTSSMPPTRKNTNLMAKASGFFQKLKPQLSVDTAVGERRRFSFEEGDDSTMSAPGMDTTPRAASSSVLSAAGAYKRGLRKSASTPLLSEHGRQQETASPERALSPVEQSPTSSTPVSSESRRVSKIPTPIYNPWTLARSRQERESSESSLLTAIKCSETTNRRSGSVSSSGYSSPSAGRMDLTAGSLGSTSNRLLEHTRTLRGNAFATAAAAKAVENNQVAVEQTALQTHEKRLSVQKADVSEQRKENARPMNASEGRADHENLH